MRPVVIAHRGASGHLPEHTRAAKALAYAMGADYLEQDVVATRDDQLVVLHDIYLDRVTDVARRFRGRARADGRYYVRDFALSEIKSLRVHERCNADGRPVYRGRFTSDGEDFRVLTFSEELELVRTLIDAHGRQVGIYPEIKRPLWHRQQGVDITPLFLQILADFGYREHHDPVYLQCFDAAELRRIRHQLGCPLKLIQLIGENSWHESSTNYHPLRSLRGLRRLARTVDGIGPWVNRLYRLRQRDGKIRSSGLTERAHKAGLAVHPYTFRSDDLPPGFADLDELLAFCIKQLAVDGLFTDFPEQVVGFLRRIPGRKASNR
ncbi:MAG: glycerophosphodiester phosphodiesterase [Gammaproteobacteria bacterium]|nr:glycerophosphodiester phosphodiesterase [Gammaproteobacteria bacterium]